MLGRLKGRSTTPAGFDAPLPDEIVDAARETGFAELPVSAAAAARVAEVPHHHRDPFDRLLIAQAITEPARLYTADRLMRRYSELVTVFS